MSIQWRALIVYCYWLRAYKLPRNKWHPESLTESTGTRFLHDVVRAYRYWYRVVYGDGRLIPTFRSLNESCSL